MTIATPTSSLEPVLLRYRNREIRGADLSLIETFASRGLTRAQLLRAVCDAWGWRQANGKPSLQGCQDLLLRLEERGHIRLPPSKRRSPSRHELPALPLDLTPFAWLPVRSSDAHLSDLVVRPVAPEERLGWRLFMGRYHYLGVRPIVGEHLLYAAFLGSELVALLGWAGAALQAPLRDRYIGWDEPTKRRQLRLVVNNIRFLIPSWVQVKGLASKVLACNLRRLSKDWQQAWGHPLWMAETFVDTSRFRGISYRAANWLYLGHTAGRSRHANRYPRNGVPKALFVYPLRRHAARALCMAKGRP